jgi:hypothetical protein
LKSGKLKIKSGKNEKELLEFSKLKEYSGYLMNKNFNNIETKLNEIIKSINGYTIYRSNSKNKYIINLNLITNQIKIKRSI